MCECVNMCMRELACVPVMCVCVYACEVCAHVRRREWERDDERVGERRRES